MIAFTKLICTTFTLLFLLSACAEEQASTPNQTAKPSKFKVAVIDKVKAANVGMPYEKATCVVETILAEGEYDLAEINQLKLTADSLIDNSSGFLKVYKSALKTCH